MVEPDEGGKISDWKSARNASIRSQNYEAKKKYFGQDILPYEKKPPAKEEVEVEGVTSDNGNNNDGSINSKISSKVPETVNMSKDSPHAIMLSAFPSSTSPWSTTLSSAMHAICCAH